MKQFISLLLLITAFPCYALAQENSQEGAKDQHQPRFWAGLSYSFAHADMKLFSCQEHAVWQGLDYGTDTLSKDEISSINSIARFTSENNVVCLEAGMVFLGSPETKWQIDGKVVLGIARTKYETYDREKESTDLSVTSPFSRLCAGLDFNFAHAFNAHWRVVANPLITYAWGSATQIEDKLNGPLLDFTEDRKEKSHTILSRVNLMAGYRIGRFTFSAGPGFYLAYNNRVYTINRTNPANGSTYFNETRSVFYNKTFLDGCLSVEWRILPSLQANLFCGIGQDIIINPGIRYLF